MLAYLHQTLHVEGVPLPEIVAHTGTPVYVYSLDAVAHRFQVYQAAFPDVLLAYACKANANPTLLARLARLGAGADVVSAGELHAALAAGIPPQRIVVNGNGKRDDEIALALRVGVRLLNLDAREEIPRVAAVAQRLGAVAPVALRVNPGLDANVHKHLQVGAAGSHFGIPREEVVQAAAEVMASPHLRLEGVHVHAGSQICNLDALEEIARAAAAIVKTLQEAGYPVRVLNLGGGLGIAYTDALIPSPAQVADRWRPFLAPLDVALILEPGRWLVGPAGILVVQVVQVKRAWGKTFVVVDGGMNALVRPALYGAVHRIVPVQQGAITLQADVVGPICESADVLGRDRLLPDVRPGDLLAILDVGAYGRSMASTYNGRPLPPEVVVQETSWWVAGMA